MKKILFVLLTFSISLWSCSDEPSDNENPENSVSTTIIDETPEPQDNNLQTEAQEPQLNADYKAFLNKFDNASLPYSLDPEKDDVSGKIPLEKQIKYLAKAEDLTKADFEDMAEYTDYFFVSKPVESNKFNAVIYARFEMGSTYYFLCTYNNDGKLIANIDFAAYEMPGAGPQAGHEYITKGNIDSGLKVSVVSDEETISYQIKEDGGIDKL